MSARPEPEPPANEVDAYRMPLLDHLRELRNRMMWSFGALFAGTLVSMAFATEILDFVRAPVDQALLAQGIDGGLSIVGSPFEGVTVWLNAAMIGGVTLASPVIAWHVWGFVAPGLYNTEKRFVGPLAMSSTILFLMGAGFAYYVLFPIAFPFFFTVVDANVSLSFQGYLSAVLKMLVAFGVCFQLPVAVFFLARLGLVDGRDLWESFRYAIVAIFVVAAIITPPDVLSQTLLAIPLLVLYFVSIAVAALVTTKKRE
ncbi:MAG: twin-arginine translocase subunit TatC [Alphaproteobacteria bacterium]|nr:twin-arginine translocase subunit TatC [Alphaproteobacteria bacterium]MCB9698175.1 twin-arginine translocase subunit TatC [Alphaproteobacteria bacterium]